MREAGPRCFLPRVAGRNCYAPDSIPCLLSFQTRPLPLLLVALPTGEILATPHAKVLRPSLCELPVATPRLSPHLRAAGKPHCDRGIASPCCADRSLSSPLHRCDAGAKHPATKPHASPLLLLPCWHRVRLRLASSCLAPHRIGTVRWHAHACRVPTTSPPI
jgi:hypothetical protein